jgi:hypothetical protein
MMYSGGGTGANRRCASDVDLSWQLALHMICAMKPPTHAMVTGLLLLPYAKIVVAEGALKAVQVIVFLVPPAADKLVSSASLLLV